MANTNDGQVMPISTDSLDYKRKYEKLGDNRIVLEDSANSVNSDLCLICHRSQNVLQAKQLISEHFNWSCDDGVESDIQSCFDANLLSVFVLRKVLNYPQSECVKIFQRTVGAVNPADWFVLCEPCLELIKQVYLLEKQLEELKLQVRKQFKTSLTRESNHEHDVSTQGCGGDVIKIREMIRNFFYGNNPINPQPFQMKVSCIDVLRDEKLELSSDVHRKRGRRRKYETSVASPYKLKMPSYSIKKHGRGRLRKSKEVQTCKNEAQLCEQSEETQIEQIAIDTADQDEDPCWSPKVGSGVEDSEEDFVEEEYLPPTAVKTFSKRMSKSKLSARKLPKKQLTKLSHRYTCKQCNKPYRYLTSYRQHLKTHEGTNPTASDSPIPGSSQQSLEPNLILEENDASRINNEELVNTTSNNETFSCSDCSEVFSSSVKQLEHRIEVHGASSSFKCELCLKYFPTRAILREHAYEAHRYWRIPHRCEICDKVLASKATYVTHVNAVHRKDIDYTCEICGFSTKCRRSLNRHRRSHDAKKFICTHCGRKFAEKSGLDNHAPVHTGEVVVCDECGHQFHTKRSLRRHIQQYHTGDNPPPVKPQNFKTMVRSNWVDKNEGKRYYAAPVHLPEKPKPSSFKCEICLESFLKPGELRVHVFEAHGHRHVPHRCEICDKVLATKGNYVEHVKLVHSKEKGFSCEICGFTTKSKYLLKRHRVKHKKETFDEKQS